MSSAPLPVALADLLHTHLDAVADQVDIDLLHGQLVALLRRAPARVPFAAPESVRRPFADDEVRP